MKMATAMNWSVCACVKSWRGRGSPLAAALVRGNGTAVEEEEEEEALSLGLPLLWCLCPSFSPVCSCRSSRSSQTPGLARC